MRGDGEVTFAIDRLDLVDGTYKLDVAVHRENGAPYDYHRLLYTFRVKSRLKEAGIFRPPHRWRFSGAFTCRVSRETSDARASCQPEEAAAFAERLRARGGRLVFTNGVFDLLHPGHVRYLSRRPALGDALIVAVNSDRSVRAIKGPARPINPEAGTRGAAAGARVRRRGGHL